MIGGLWKSTSSLAMLAAVGLFVGVPSAKAADLGGDCCADLEERVAELEATTARKGNRRVSLTISGQVSTSIMAWDDGGSVVGVGFPAGNVNLAGSNGGDAYVVDNTVAGGTFFSLSGSARINPNLTAGFNVTVGICSGARSHTVNQNDDDTITPAGGCTPGSAVVNDSTLALTLANWYLDHKSWGRVTVGRANTATAGLTTIDLGGAGVIASANIGYWQRGMNVILDIGGIGVIFPDTWNTLLGGASVNGSGLSRGNVINYTSPTFGGFNLQAAWGENDVWDAALRYAGEFSGFRVAAGIGYISNQNGLNEIFADIPALAGAPEPTQWKGSASVLHVASGLFLTGAYVNQDNDVAGRRDTTLWYAQGGISKNWTGLGNTVLYGEYSRVDGGVNASTLTCAPGNTCLVPAGGFGNVVDSTAEVWGLGVVQHVDAAAMELYLSYRNYSAEYDILGFGQIPGISIRDMDVVMGGARIRF